MFEHMSGTIERRLLVNYRVDPEALLPLLPDGLVPIDVQGSAIAGICMLRLTQVRPKGLPSAIGVTMESAAHRIGVQWTGSDGGLRTGVYIPVRHTASLAGALAGGRIFPGVHERADFTVTDEAAATGAVDGARVEVAFSAADGTQVDVRSTSTTEWASAAFPDFSDAKQFFRCAPIGWSPRRGATMDTERQGRIDAERIEGVSMEADMTGATPIALSSVRSTFFDRLGGAAELDSALVLRRVAVEWTALSGADDAEVAACVI